MRIRVAGGMVSEVAKMAKCAIFCRIDVAHSDRGKVAVGDRMPGGASLAQNCGQVGVIGVNDGELTFRALGSVSVDIGGANAIIVGGPDSQDMRF